MKNAAPLLIAILILGGCATTEKEPPPDPPAREESAPPAEPIRGASEEPPADEPAAEEPRETGDEELPSPPPEVPEPPVLPDRPPKELIPEGMELVTRDGALLRVPGDYNGDGLEDAAFLAVTGTPATMEALGSRERLHAANTLRERRAAILLLISDGAPVSLDPGPLPLLAEISAQPLHPHGTAPENRSTGVPDLLYLRLENRENQRHLLFSVNPEYGNPYRYLFVTDTETGFLLRDVEGDGIREAVHLENRLTPGGIEETYLTVYKFRGRELRRHSRLAVVEQSNNLLEAVRGALLSGTEGALREFVQGDEPTEAYFAPEGSRHIKDLREIRFVTVPELRANPFDLDADAPTVTTEILLVDGAGEHLFSVTLGILFSRESEPRVLLLPVSGRISD